MNLADANRKDHAARITTYVHDGIKMLENYVLEISMSAATMITPSYNEDDEGDKQNDNKDEDVT